MSTFLGMITAFALVIIAILIGGDPMKFLNLQGFLIVVVGTFAVTAISFRFTEIITMPKNIFSVLKRGHVDPSVEAIKMLKIAAEARRLNDDLKLEKLLPAIKGNAVLHKAIQLIVDGSSAEEIEQVLRRESSTNADRHMRAVAFLRRAGDVAPAMGLIGTLIGLIKMLGNLNDPSLLGPAMAVALLTTFYGALMAHLVFIPLAAKTEHCSSEEALVDNLYAMGAASIRRKENPRRLEMLLNTVLPPSQRVTYFQ